MNSPCPGTLGFIDERESLLARDQARALYKVQPFPFGLTSL